MNEAKETHYHKSGRGSARGIDTIPRLSPHSSQLSENIPSDLLCCELQLCEKESG